MVLGTATNIFFFLCLTVYTFFVPFCEYGYKQIVPTYWYKQIYIIIHTMYLRLSICLIHIKNMSFTGQPSALASQRSMTQNNRSSVHLPTSSANVYLRNNCFRDLLTWVNRGHTGLKVKPKQSHTFFHKS